MKRLICAMTVAAPLLLPGMAGGATTINMIGDLNDESIWAFHGYDQFQTFRAPTVDTYLTSFSILYNMYVGPPRFDVAANLYLWDASASLPSGSVLWSGTGSIFASDAIIPSTVFSQLKFADFLDVNINLSSGLQYVLTLTEQQNFASGVINQSVYLDGTGGPYLPLSQTEWLPTGESDLPMKMEFTQQLPGCGPSGGVPPKCNPPVIPLPATLPLLAAGLSCFGLMRRFARSSEIARDA